MQRRPLTSAERSVLDRLLSLDFAGVTELRAQAEVASVTGRCRCGCPSVELAVPADAPRSACGGALAPAEGTVPVDDGPPDEVMLFLDDGRLSYLELVHYGEQAPSTWPPADRIAVEVTRH